MTFDYQMFKSGFKGFDKDEVLSYIQKQEEDYEKQISDLQKELKNRDKLIAELKGRIQQKDEQRELLEKEIETKYKKYIDNYDKIGSLVYESQIKGDKMIADAKAQADRIIAEADKEAQNKVSSVRSEVDAKLADGKQKYMAVQDAMNDIVELINEAQRRFMTSYKSVHEIVQSMPGSLHDIDLEADGEKETPEEEDTDTADTFETGELNFDASAFPIDADDDEDAETEKPVRGTNVEELSAKPEADGSKEEKD